jgi:ComF family protein
MNDPGLTPTPPHWKSWLDAGLSFLYPEVCQYCTQERATADDGFIGAECRKNVKAIARPFCERCGLPFEGEITTHFECGNCRDAELHFSSARSAVAAKGMMLELIHRYKYGRALWLEPFLAELLIQHASPRLLEEKWDMIVPVPLHPLKQSEREFNQAERLGRRLSVATHLPLRKDLLCRVVQTQTQTLLSRADRTANVQRAFACKTGGSSLKGQRVVLVDDVLTTGATTSACAKVLLKHGASEVCVWTVARGLLK